MWINARQRTTAVMHLGHRRNLYDGVRRSGDVVIGCGPSVLAGAAASGNEMLDWALLMDGAVFWRRQNKASNRTSRATKAPATTTIITIISFRVRPRNGWLSIVASRSFSSLKRGSA